MAETGPASFNVLVSCGGGFQGQAVISGLREAGGVRISMADHAAINANRYLVDRFHAVPAVDPAGPYVDALARICRDDAIDLMIPSSDIELAAVAAHRSVLEETGAWVAVSDATLLAQLRHKGRLHRALEDAGFPVVPEVDLGAAPVPFPILGKPMTGWGGRGQIVARSSDELPGNLPDLRSHYLWQPLIDELTEYSVDAAIGEGGRVSPLVARLRRHTTCGFATVTDAVSDDDVIELAARLTDFLLGGGRGLFNFQFLRLDGGLVVSDVNPRIGTSAVFGNHAGANLPLFLCRCLGAPVPPAPRLVDGRRVRLVRHLCDRWVEGPGEVAVDGLVFDLDDTLVDHKRWILAKLDGLPLDDPGLPERGALLATALRVLEEGNRSRLFDAVAGELGLAAGVRDRLIASYRAVEPTQAPLFPETAVALRELAFAGYRLAVVTDNPPESQAAKLEVAGLEGILDAVIYTRELGAEKPDPGGFRAAAEQLGLRPGRLAAVGDNPYRDAVGALDAKYAAAFWVARAGTFLNPHTDAVTRVLGSRDGVVHRIGDLRELAWYLRQGPR